MFCRLLSLQKPELCLKQFRSLVARPLIVQCFQTA
ncbi:hypothetical protein LINPERPRIM_LOCUS14778 [Linum perenne]